jgi:hypothetical protein
MQDIQFEKARTSIRVRLSTRNMIQDRSLPGESMDDSLVRILNENEIRSKEVERLRNLLDVHKIKEPNLISNYTQTRNTDLIQPTDGILIEFSYNAPTKDDPDYRMDITIERIVKDDRIISFDELDLNNKERIDVYFSVIERIINENFDRGFALPRNRNLMDPKYWKRVWKRVGLTDISYINDVLKVMNAGLT